MDRNDLERRFRERAARFRRDYFWFLAGAAVLSAFVAAGAGFLLYTALSFLYFRFTGRSVPLGTFAIAYTVLFVTIGYAQYRRQPKDGEALSNPADGLPPWLPRLAFEVPLFWSGAAGLYLLVLCFTFPSLIFHFAHELYTGRHLFASESVERLALELLVEGGDKVSPELLARKLESDPEALRRAIKLLLEMKLLLLRGRRGEPALLRTIEGTSFLEGASAAPH